MKDRKLNLDRPQLTENEIMAGKNFDAIVQNYQMMSKPFYKQTWFFGTTGLASLGLIIGGTLAFQNTPDSSLSVQNYSTDAPPEVSVPNTKFIDLKTYDSSNEEEIDYTISTNISQNSPTIEKKSTPKEKTKNDVLVNNSNQNGIISQENLAQNDVVLAPTTETIQDNAKKNSAMDMYPRISDKIGGTITREELLNNNGITTEGDVNVIHFELHLIDGLGGKVYSEDGNQLNQEMKNALDKVQQGETIYFENIRGKVKDGKEVRLNPLRYVLMN